MLWRIIPFVFALYVVSYIDRANIGYAALQMNQELGLSSSAFGFAAGVFFIGYFLFEVPSNLALARFGARVWIARILIMWGIVAALSAFVHSALQLYVLRFLLGAAEAGFFPGIIIYLTYWFRAKDQATSVALFTAAIPVSYLLGAPLSTWIMDHATGFGLSGWRWMLLLEGVPALLGGIACYLFLTDTPDAGQLADAGREALARRGAGQGSPGAAPMSGRSAPGRPSRLRRCCSWRSSISSTRPAASASGTGCRRSLRACRGTSPTSRSDCSRWRPTPSRPSP